MADPRALSSDDLLELVAGQRWFAGNDRRADRAELVGIPFTDGPLALGIVEIGYATGTHEHYQLAFALDTDDARDALSRPELMARLAAAAGVLTEGADVRPMGVEQSNSSVVLDRAHVLKLYRRLEAGPSPELELLQALAAQGFRHAPRLEGALETAEPPLETALLAITALVPAAGDAWNLTLDRLDDPGWLPTRTERLGEVVASLHGALAADTSNPHLAPEEPSAEAIPLVVAQLDEEITATFDALGPVEAAAPIAGRAEDVRELARELHGFDAPGLRIRTHGDLHLGQVLWTDEGDWLVLDFEGEPGRSLPERRLKQSVLRDLAGMTRSFAYVAEAARLTRQVELEPDWAVQCRGAFVDGYLRGADKRLLPSGRDGLERLLLLFELEKLVYELRYEIRNRPGWVAIPVAGILRLLERA